MTGTQIIYAALTIATGVTADSDNAPLADGETVAETLLPAVVKEVISAALQNDGRVQETIKAHALTFANGTAALPDTVLAEGLELAGLTLAAPNTAHNGRMSRVAYAFDYNRPLRRELGYWCLDGANVLARLPGGSAGALNAGATLSAPTVPNLSNLNAETTLTPSLEQDVKVFLASALRGEAVWQRMTTDYPLLMAQAGAGN